MNPDLKGPVGRDPLADLVEVLTEIGQPPEGWVERWSQDGAPIEAAWNASRDPVAMRDLLRLAHYPDMQTVEAIVGEASRSGAAGEEVAEDVRRAVPMPPSMDELLLALGITSRE